jgi:AmpD protein
MQVDVASGRLAGVRYVESPHQDERPEDCHPELVIVHGISLPPGEFGGPYIEQLFTHRLDLEAHPYFRNLAGLRVSSHVLVDRAGKLVQFVPFHRRAWHAGQSGYFGRTACNDFSIGVELEGCDEVAYADAQYLRLAELAFALALAYPGLASMRMVGHRDVAPGRKSDPGVAFDWLRMDRILAVARARRRGGPGAGLVA